MADERSLRVLVVDDDPDHRYLMARRLLDAGHRPTTIADPADIDAHLDHCDLVVLDYRIPGTSGISLLAQIVRRGGPPVVMVTGMGSESVAVEALQAGATDYLIKSGDYLDRLPASLAAAWRRHDLSRRSAALQAMGTLITGVTDVAQVIDGITTGARQLLSADGVRLEVGEGVVAQPADPGVPVTRMAVPVVASTGEVLGAIVVENAAPRAYTADDLELVESLASFAAIGLSNAKELEQERQTADRLRGTLDQRRQLVAAVGHELRTPLTAIAGFAATLLRHWDSFSDRERREMVERIDRNSGDLTEIVTRLMDYAYMDSGRMEPQLGDVDLPALVGDVVASLSGVLGAATVMMAIPDLSVRADETLLRRVLVNLVTNATKYGGDQPRIDIEAVVDRDRVKVTVTDSGPGIEAADLDRVFEAFYRSTRDRRRRPGTGIGLALVRDYLRVMDGEVGVASPAGTGASFWFTLPLAG